MPVNRLPTPVGSSLQLIEPEGGIISVGMSVVMQSLFATTPLVPAVLNTSISGTNQLIGLKLFPTVRGLFTSIRYFRDASEPCTGHTGTIFFETGETLLSVAFNETCTLPRVGEWISQEVTSPFELLPSVVYTVVVGPFKKYPYTPNFFNVTGYRNGDLSVIPDATTTGRPGARPAAPRGTRFKATNFFIDVGFQRTQEPTFFRCNATAPSAVAAAQTLFNSTENVTGLSVSTSSRTRVPIGVRFRAQKGGYILAIRWFKDPREPNNPHLAIFYDVRTKGFLSEFPIVADCASGWISQNLPGPLRIEAGQEVIAAIHGVTRYPLANNYFRTPMVSGDLIATAGVRGPGRNLAMPNRSFPRSGNPWVDVVFSEQGYDCSFYSPDGTGCDDGNPCTWDDKCGAGTCQSGPLNQCQVSSVANVCNYRECDPATGGCSIVRNREVGYVCNDYDLCTSTDVCNGGGGCFGTSNATACPACSGPALTGSGNDEGFEFGGGGWTLGQPESGVGPFLSGDSPRTGAGCLKFEGFFVDETAVSSPYTLTTGTKYMLTVWARGVGSYASIGLIDASNSSVVVAEVTQVELGERGGVWRQVPVIFTATSVTSVRVRIFHQYLYGTTYIDDVSICPVA